MLHHTFIIFHIYISYLQYLKPYQNSSCVMIICCRTSSTYIVHHSLSHWQIVSSNFISTNHTSSNIMLPHCNILPHLAHTSWHHIKPGQTLSLKKTSSCLIKNSSNLPSFHLVIPHDISWCLITSHHTLSSQVVLHQSIYLKPAALNFTKTHCTFSNDIMIHYT